MEMRFKNCILANGTNEESDAHEQQARMESSPIQSISVGIDLVALISITYVIEHFTTHLGQDFFVSTIIKEVRMFCIACFVIAGTLFLNRKMNTVGCSHEIFSFLLHCLILEAN